MLFKKARRISASPQITHAPFCDLAAVSLDNTTVLPPFTPSVDRAAQLYGSSLLLCDPTALFGHVPCGVVQDSKNGSSCDIGATKAGRLTVSDLLMAALSMCGGSPWATPSDRMCHVGRQLCLLGQRPDPECKDWLQLFAMTKLSTDLMTIDRMTDRSSEVPAHWKAALIRYRGALLTAIDEPDWHLPRSLVVKNDASASVRNVKSLLYHVGALFEAWPALWESKRGDTVDLK